MRFLLHLKHWQLFSLTWGVAFLLALVSFTADEMIVELFPLMIIIITTGFLGWVWAIAVQLHNKLPAGVPLTLRHFKVFFSIPVVYSFLIIAWLSYSIFVRTPVMNMTMGILLVFVFTIHLASMVCIVLGIRFAAKTLKSIELGRHARFNDYVAEFFLIWFSIVGIWVLQPTLNKLTKD